MSILNLLRHHELMETQMEESDTRFEGKELSSQLSNL